MKRRLQFPRWKRNSQTNGGGSPPVGLTSDVLAANRGQFPTNIATIPDQTASMREFWFSPEGDVTNFVVHDVNTYINGSFALVSQPAATFQKWLEYPLGVFKQLLYGGLTTYSMSTGIATCDPVTDVVGLAGTRGWIHTVQVSGANRDVACVELPANASTIGVSDTKYTWTGTPEHPAAQASTLFFGANFITGDVAKDNARGFGFAGHSIPFGQGDISSSGPKGGSGYHARGLDNRYPWAKFCKGGMDTSNMAGLRTSGLLIGLINKLNLTDIIQDYTGGDLRNGTSVAAIKEAIQTVFGMFGNSKRFYLVTALDRTDSTDAYATVVNQTPKTDGNWASQITLNTDIRAGLPRVTAVLDTCSVSSSSFNSGVWNGSPARSTDGVHPNSFECDRLATTYVAGFDFVIPAPGAWNPSFLGNELVGAWDTNDVNQVTDDGSGNLVRMRATYGGGDLLPGASPNIITTGGVGSNKRVISFAAAEYLQSLDARILLGGSGPVASNQVTVIEAMRFVTGATSRGFMLGSIGGVSGAPNIAIRQTTTNRGPSVTPVSGGSAFTAFQAVFDGLDHVHTVLVDGVNIVYRVDGVQVATGTIVGGTNFSFSQFLIGAVVGASAGVPTSLFPPATHAGMIMTENILTGTDLTNAEAWVGATIGL